MAFPTRGQVKQLFLQKLDDPAGRVYTDEANPTTGALSVFQAGFSEAFDILFNNALVQQVPKVEKVVDGIIVPAVPQPFSLTPAEMGLTSFADWDWIAERAAGSTDKFIDLYDEDRLTQRPAVDRLLETVYQDGAFQFVGCTSVRELQIKYVYSGSAPTDDDESIAFDNSLNFLANYAAGVMGPNKGDDAAARYRMFAVGPRFDNGQIGGELFRLLQPLVRSRQNVQVAHKPFTTQRRRLGSWRGVPYVAAQQGTTGGGAQNVPVQFSSADGTITGAINGTNAVFYLTMGNILSIALYRNGALQTPTVDYTALNNQITFEAASIPISGDLLTAEVYIGYA